MDYALDFERPVYDLENQIKELRQASGRPNLDLSKEVDALQQKVHKLIQEIYGNLTDWERVQLSRHPQRPHTIDYIQQIFADFHEIHGDRKFSTDHSMICGFGMLDGERVAVIGIEKGRNTKEKIHRNFGMSKPEGYRKAMRVMELAAQFHIPVITLVDTPGAYPGVGAEERGQASAIADNLAQMFDIKTPIISIVIGEGGSGGALGIAVADLVLMMEYSIYSVISPESCASILWSDPKNAEMASNALQLNPERAMELMVIDGVVKEPMGGAHRNHTETMNLVRERLLKELKVLKKVPMDELLEKRFKKFRAMGNQTLLNGTDSSNGTGKEKYNLVTPSKR